MTATAHGHRVVVYSHSADLAGAEQALVRVVRHLVDCGIEMLVIVPRPGPLVPRLEAAGAAVVRSPLPKWLARTKAWPVFLARLVGAVLSFPRLVYITRRFGPCVAYTNSWVVPSGALAARLLGVPHVWHIREYVPGNETLRSQLPLTTVRRATERWTTELVAMSASVAQQFVGSSKPVRVVHVGVDTPTTVVDKDTDAATWLRAGKPSVLVLGTVSAAKGTPTAVAMMAQLRSEFPAARLLIVGSGTSATMVELRTQIAELDLDATVRVEAFRDDPWVLRDSVDVLVVPSRHEAYGLVTVEALARGVPVVGTATGGTRELLAMGGGLLAFADDADHFAAHVAAIATDAELAHWLGERGLAVATSLDPAAEGRDLERAVRRLCKYLGSARPA
jgi:glycosyltransferase involved in cell wall biosynthesis